MNELISMANEFYMDYKVIADVILYSFFVTFFKVALSSNKRSKNVASDVISKGEEIVKIGKASAETLTLMKGVLKENKYLKSHIETIEKREDMLADMLKDFVKSSGIKIDDKLAIAKKYDEFKALLQSDGEQVDTVQEIVDVENTMTQEEIDELDTMLEGLTEQDEEV